MDVSRRDQLYTIDDIYALPDGVRAELVDGKKVGIYKRFFNQGELR